MKTRTESAGLQLRRTDRVAVVAGNGSLPRFVIEGLVAQGLRPFVIAIEGEARIDAAPATFDVIVSPLESLGRMMPRLKQAGVTHMVLAGGVTRRPAFHRIGLEPGIIRHLPRLFLGLGSGDDALLRAVVGYVEGNGIRIVGAHEVVPDLLTSSGAISQAKPTRSDWKDIRAGFAAAKAIGALDIGQAAIAVGGRVIALEGIEGTDGLLIRARELRRHSRIASVGRGVLVKCAKPGQEMRADLPAIGPDSVDAAHAAGLAGIAVEAGRSILLAQAELLRRADQAGLFVVGVSGDEP